MEATQQTEMLVNPKMHAEARLNEVTEKFFLRDLLGAAVNLKSKKTYGSPVDQ
jgi:hypothetical protein